MNINPEAHDSRYWMSVSLEGCTGYDKGKIEYGVVDDDGGIMIALCPTKDDADVIADRLNGSKSSKLSRSFVVTDGTRQGICYAWPDHFDIIWDDGDYLKTIELSTYSIRKL